MHKHKKIILSYSQSSPSTLSVSCPDVSKQLRTFIKLEYVKSFCWGKSSGMLTFYILMKNGKTLFHDGKENRTRFCSRYSKNCLF